VQLLVATALIVVVAAAALVLQRRRSDPPTQGDWQVPTQLDRADFDGQDRDWIVVTFTSESCHTCADVKRKANVLASRDVAVVDVEYGAQRALHERYTIDAVPALVIADRDGVVRASFLGPVTATDLWAAYAEVRDPSS
jgi:hypothetical protein